MTLGDRCAAEAPERFSISPGRTCGFAAKIVTRVAFGMRPAWLDDVTLIVERYQGPVD